MDTFRARSFAGQVSGNYGGGYYIPDSGQYYNPSNPSDYVHTGFETGAL